MGWWEGRDGWRREREGGAVGWWWWREELVVDKGEIRDVRRECG